MLFTECECSGYDQHSRENKEPEGDREARHICAVTEASSPHWLQERGWSYKGWGYCTGVTSPSPSETAHGRAPPHEGKPLRGGR